MRGKGAPKGGPGTRNETMATSGPPPRRVQPTPVCGAPTVAKWRCVDEPLERIDFAFLEDRPSDGVLTVSSRGRPHVEVRASSIHGLGVFAARPFAPGDAVGVYSGHVMPADRGSEAGGDYDIEVTFAVDAATGLGARAHVDGSRPPQSQAEQLRALRLPFDFPPPFPYWVQWPGAYMHLMNDGTTSRRNNCLVFEDGSVVATCDIATGDELLWDYGSRYWRGRARA